MMYLTRRFAFSSSHQLVSPHLDGPTMACTYGPCTNIHGHNYRLEVTVRGVVDPKTGFFCNVMELARIVEDLVVRHADHRFLNDVPLFQGMITTMENIAGRVWTTIEPALAGKGMELVEVLVAETDDHCARLR
jgi:6-pyruvoyltetrahydropterin/6-carboxytetrahydropterin synthase